MDLKQIHELIKIVNKSNIGEISIEDKDGKVTIKQKEEPAITVAAPQHQVYTTAPAPAPAATSAPAALAAPAKADNLITIKSPMIGTFYRRPSPNSAPFVEVGDAVKPDTDICIVEVMKLLNTIPAGCSGTVSKILVEDGATIEAGQALMVIEVA